MNGAYFLYHSIGMYPGKARDMAAAMADFALLWGTADDAQWGRGAAPAGAVHRPVARHPERKGGHRHHLRKRDTQVSLRCCRPCPKAT